eukprot:XP_014002027.1 PREDICTED: NEDD8-activating enzyme E1 catalytic subunit-like isoform X2 [Salmo salar]
MADAEEPMAVDGDSRDWDGRWNHVKKFLERPGPFTHPDFEPSIESLGFLLETCKILVIGAGGLGCELLKNLGANRSRWTTTFLLRGGTSTRPCQVFVTFMLLTWIPLISPISTGSSFSGPKMLDGQKQMWLLTLSMVASLDVKSSHISTKSKTLINLSTDMVLVWMGITLSTSSGCSRGPRRELLTTASQESHTDSHKENCSACSQVPQDLQFPPSAKLQEVLEYLTENASLQMKSPAITATLEGKNKTLYLQTIASIEERTRPNLCKTLKELGLSDGQELAVADVTTPQTVLFKLKLTFKGLVQS